MKYYTICFPGEYGQHIQETWSEDQILSSYWKYWQNKMQEAGKHDLISEKHCIEDWCIIHWAVQTDEFGGKL